MTQKKMTDLYQETILRYGKNPRNFRSIPGACCSLNGQNRMCGDYLTVHISLDGSSERRIVDISFEGDGCAILKASASMMTELLVGKTVADVQYLHGLFQKMVRGEPGTFVDLGPVSIFSGLGMFQSRIQCAVLPWDTLAKGIESQCLPK